MSIKLRAKTMGITVSTQDHLSGRGGAAPSFERCQSKAAECEQLAELETDIAVRVLYLRMAQHWRQLTDQS
jgi:hypothetical protein